MNFVRMSLLRREQADEGLDLEQQTPAADERQTQNGRGLFTMARPALPGLFMGRLSLGVRGRGPSEHESGEDGSLKSPVVNYIRPRIPSLEDGIPDSQAPSQPPRARTRTQRFPVLARPLAARTSGGETERHVRRSIFNGSSPAELHLANTAESGRQQRQAHHSRDRSGSSRTARRKEPPKKFLFCFPWVRSRRARSLILRCFVSGVFLISMLTVYLSLSITKNINTSEFSILLIILILLTTIFFCHGLILLCMILVRPRKRQNTTAADVEASKYGHPGYAIPTQPIRVVLARDEEAAGIESETTKLKPPAYGLWRESVRVDPNRIYWQRAGSPLPSSVTSSSLSSSSASSTTDDDSERYGPRAARRPPSYASDDGIEYVLDARPRSIAPPPSSVYSQTSTMGTPLIVNMANAPPLPHPALRGPSTSAVAGRSGNWSMV
ncbi:hypothetical protein SAMD00023353_0402730 [Rosellinia necatrix]|uniref:Uncharacterized protein n=1 Tax=Rosellinia necatrix TaxID=77044 RepID=A0A1S7UJ31_ROSNE|nr:hypothetical protein SAMD00023353_0402730 [Rosellinia necatrix]